MPFAAAQTKTRCFKTSYACALMSVMALGVLAFVGGCKTGKPPVQPPQPYTGPILTLDALQSAVQRRSAGISTLWSRHSFEVSILDENKKRQEVSGDGVLLYYRSKTSPLGGRLRIVGNKDVAGSIFELGCDDTRYWLTIVPELSTQWWGRISTANLPCSEKLAVRPDGILAVLALAAPPSDADTNEPLPAVLRFDPVADVYRVLYVSPSSGGPVASREVTYDRQTLLPMAVTVYDALGRITLQAELSEHKPIVLAAGSAAQATPNGTAPRSATRPGAAAPARQTPVIATHYRIVFPMSQATMILRLRDTTDSRSGVPNERSIRFPADPAVSTQVQIDADCK